MGAALLQSAASLEAGLKSRANPRYADGTSQAPLDLGALWAQLQQLWLAYAVAVEGVVEPAALQALRVRWDQADAQGPLARQAANQAIADYHAALDQAPAAWLAGTMGFRKVPPLG
jgi:hypothetical protein